MIMCVHMLHLHIGGMFTANTMSPAVETLGMSLTGHLVCATV